MNAQRILIVWLVFAFLLIGAPPAAAAPAQQEPIPDSNQPPPGYRPAAAPRSVAATEEGADILLIQTALPWDSSADTIVLDSLGYSYDIVDMSGIGAVNLFNYPVILIVNDQQQAFYDSYAAQVAAFETYVNNGGILVFFAASDGWANGSLQAPLPGGVSVVTPFYEYYNYIVDAEHPIVAGVLSDNVALVDADLYNNYCSHGYFENLPAGTDIVLRTQQGYPTLVDYKLGNGRVIASTQTWEHAYKYYSRAFAIKALDDVFLYAFSGGGGLVRDLSVDLRVDDAPDGVRVNKSAGSYVDFVALVTSAQEYAPTITLQVPAAVFGAPVKTFTRDLASNSGYGQENQYKDLGGGQYAVQTTLTRAAGDPVRYRKEIVWRFQAPTDAQAQKDLAVSVKASLPNSIVLGAQDNNRVDIVKCTNTIVITNRQRLYDMFGAGDTDAVKQVSMIFRELHRALADHQGEVFYVDDYGINYDPAGDVNRAVDEIDDLLEGWYKKLTTKVFGFDTCKPAYLVIVGDHSVIPFYEVASSDEDHAAFPIVQGKYLTDNIYADTDGKQDDWETGELELAAGRVVGATPRAMWRFIVKASMGPATLKAGTTVSIKGMDADPMWLGLVKLLKTVHGISDPAMYESDDWSKADFLSVWPREYQYFFYGGHADPRTLAPRSSDEDDYTYADELGAGQILANWPLMQSTGCNSAAPVANGLVHKYIDLGFSGMVGPTGLSYFNDTPVITRYGEKLAGIYFEGLIDTWGVRTQEFGKTLLAAKAEYRHWGMDDYAKKTVMEYVYYGLPWTTMEIYDLPFAAMTTAAAPAGFQVQSGSPQRSAAGGQTVVINTAVTSYTINTVEGFDLLNVPGADTASGAGVAALPYVTHVVKLPPGSTVTNVTIQAQQPVDLGVRNIPQLLPLTTYDTGSGLAPLPQTGGTLPAQRLAYVTAEKDSYLEVKLLLSLAQVDSSTGQTTIFRNTAIQIEYAPTTPVIVDDLQLAATQVGAGSELTGTARLASVLDTRQIFQARLDIYDALGTLAASQNLPDLALDPGAATAVPFVQSGNLAPGAYTAVFSLRQGDVIQAAATQAFAVQAGAIQAFTIPPVVNTGEYATVQVNYANFTTNNVDGTAEVILYDANSLPAGKLLLKNFSAGAQAAALVEWAWNADSLAPGLYTAQAFVTANGNTFVSAQQPVAVLPDVTLGALQVAAAPAALVADGVSTTTVTALVLDTANSPVKGFAVAFAASSGQISEGIVTDENGLARATFVASTRSGGVTVSANAGNLNGETTIVLTPGAPAQMFMSAATTTLVADGQATSQITIDVTDLHGNRTGGQNVTLATNLGSLPAAVVTDAAGKAQATLRAPQKVGEATIIAQTGAASDTIKVEFIAGPAALLSIAADPKTIVADGASTSRIALSLTDAFGNPKDGQRVTFSTSSGAVSATATTDALGRASAILTSTRQPGVAIVTASSGVLTNTASVKFAGGGLDGLVFWDLNADGRQAPGETGIAAIGVTLTHQESNVVYTAQTDAAGRYALNDLMLGVYKVTLAVPPGRSLTTAPGITVEVKATHVTMPGAGFRTTLFLPATSR